MMTIPVRSRPVQCWLAASLSYLWIISAAAADNPANSAGLFEMSLEELMNEPVTARKRVENVQSVPISVTVLSSERLASIQARDLADVVGYVPNLQLDYNSNS